MKIDDFLRIENKYNLLNVEIEGVKVWRYMRFSIWNYKICTEGFKLSDSHTKLEKSFWQSIKNIVCILHNSFRKRRFKRKDYDICFISHERRVKIDGYYKCIYTEKLADRFQNSITIEQPFGFNHFEPIKNDNMVYTDYILWAGEVFCALNVRLISKRYRRIIEQVETYFEQPLDELMAIYDVNLNKKYLYEILARKVMAVNVERPYYEKLIKKISPKLIVEVNHYGTQCMIVNEIASKIGIKTIELQHGTMYKEHAAYQYGTDEKIEQLPQILLTFSEYWNEIIKMPLDSTKVIATGFPYFEERVSVTKKNVTTKSDKKNILFISQGTIAKPLIDLALDLNEILDKDQYSIVYKLHPSEYAGWDFRYPELKSSDIQVIDNSDTNLYDLFAQSTIQVGVYSTAIYEGIGFGLETYIYNIAHADAMKKLVGMGAAQYVESANKLADNIMTEKQVRDISSVLWKNHAFENICDVIESMLYKKE